MDSILPTIHDTIVIDTLKNKITVIQNVTTKEEITKSNISNPNCECYWPDITMKLIWPITILILVILCRNQLKILLENIAKRTNKIKVPGIGLELELDKLNDQTEQVERTFNIKEERLNKKSEYHRDFYHFRYPSGQDIKTNFLIISLEIENILRLIYGSNIKREIGGTPFAVPEIIETLYAEKIIDRDLLDLLRKFWKFRNNIIHAHKYTVEDEEFLALIDIGIRVMRILESIDNSFN